MPARSKTATVMLLVTIFLVSLNMRGVITAVGPLIDQIAADTGYSLTVLGLLGSIPMLMWAVVSPFVHALTVRFGLNATMAWGLTALGLATVLRSVALPGEAALWIGTMLIGAALAVINVLMPVATRRDFESTSPTVMSINTNMIVVAAAAASGLAVPLSHIQFGGGELGWRIALLCMGILLPFALILWLISHRRTRHHHDAHDAAEERTEPAVAAADTLPSVSTSVARAVWRDRLAWLIAWYMALQGVQFFIIATWLPKIEIDRGVSETNAGLEVMLMQLAGMVATACLPLLRRTRLQARLPASITVPGIIAALGLVFWPAFTPLWVIVLGVSSGPMLAIPLILIAERSRDTATATALSGMSQAFGYLVAGLGPILFGWLHTLVGNWQVPLVVYLFIILAIAVVGWLIRPGWYVFDRSIRVDDTASSSSAAPR